MNIYLIRHAEKVPEVGDPGLSQKGIRQTGLLAAYFEDKRIDLMISSPSIRSRQTAELIKSDLHIKLSFDSKLKERLSFGDVEKQTYEEYLGIVGRSSRDRNYVLPNGDSSISVGNKILEVIKGVDSKYKNIAIISHGGSISDFLRNTFSEDLLKEMSPDYFIKMEVDSASVSKLSFDKNKFKLIFLNKTL